MTDEKRQNALNRILKVVNSSQTRLYAVTLGGIVLAQNSLDPTTVQAIEAALATPAGQVGLNMFVGLLDALSSDDTKLSDDEIRAQVEQAIDQTNIADLLTRDQFRQDIARLSGGMNLRILRNALQAGQRDIVDQILEQMELNQLMLMEQMNTLREYMKTPDDTLKARTDKQIFISYSRANTEFARDLRAKLEALGFNLWRDREEMVIGDDWWRQIKEAIDACETMILCMSPDSLASEVVAKEWHYARQVGTRVMPVVVVDVDFDGVPRWMERRDWADFREDAKEADKVWTRFITQLNTPRFERNVPFMVRDLPPDFVPRPNEFDSLVSALVDDKDGAVAITAALKGAGGYGKTTLARAICHDVRVRSAFDDGILWVTLGKSLGEPDLISHILDLVYKLLSARPAIKTLEAATDELKNALGDQYILLVIDDVWDSKHLAPFLDGGPNTARLITTRNSDTLPREAKPFKVDALKTEEAIQLLRYGLPKGEDKRITQLAKRLGKWALLLKLANGVLQKQLQRKTLTESLDFVDKALEKRGFDGLKDPSNPVYVVKANRAQERLR